LDRLCHNILHHPRGPFVTLPSQRRSSRTPTLYPTLPFQSHSFIFQSQRKKRLGVTLAYLWFIVAVSVLLIFTVVALGTYFIHLVQKSTSHRKTEQTNVVLNLVPSYLYLSKSPLLFPLLDHYNDAHFPSNVFDQNSSSFMGRARTWSRSTHRLLPPRTHSFLWYPISEPLTLNPSPSLPLLVLLYYIYPIVSRDGIFASKAVHHSGPGYSPLPLLPFLLPRPSSLSLSSSLHVPVPLSLTNLSFYRRHSGRTDTSPASRQKHSSKSATLSGSLSFTLSRIDAASDVPTTGAHTQTLTQSAEGANSAESSATSSPRISVSVTSLRKSKNGGKSSSKPEEVAHVSVSELSLSGPTESSLSS